MKPITYIANMRLPSERAHSGQIMRMCVAFARNGADTTLMVPSRKTHTAEDPFEYYGSEPIFNIKRLWSIDLFVYSWMPHVIAYWINALTFSMSLLFRIKTLKKTTIFSRDPISSFILSWFAPSVIYEIHDTPKLSWFNKMFLKKIPFIVATNTWKKKVLIEKFGVGESKILVAHHGVDAQKFAVKISQIAAKQKLQLDLDTTYIVYTGHLYDWKGVYTLARAAKLLPKNMHVLMVGGTEKDVASMKNFCEREDVKNITCTGFKKHENMPVYQAAASVLVIPTSARYTIGKHESSPLKLFEYMACGKPIIASDLPAIRDIVDDAHVYFMQPDSATQCAKIIEDVFNGEHTKQEAAKQRVAEQTWEQRAAAIIKHIRTCQA